MPDISIQPGLDCRYTGHQVELLVKDYCKNFLETCKDIAVENKAKYIDADIIRLAMLKLQYVIDFWGKPKYMVYGNRSFFEDNSVLEGPVTLTPEYIDWIGSKTAAYLSTEAGKEEWDIWKNKLDKDRKVLHDNNMYTIRAGQPPAAKTKTRASDPVPSQGKNRASEPVPVIPSSHGKNRASDVGVLALPPAASDPTQSLRGPGPAPKQAPKFQPLTPDLKKVFGEKIEVYRGTAPKEHAPGSQVFYVYTAHKDQEGMEILVAHGMVPFGMSNEVLNPHPGTDDKYARDIFARTGLKMHSWNLLQKHLRYIPDVQVKLPDSLAAYQDKILPVSLVNDRVEFLVAHFNDYPLPGRAKAIAEMWKQFNSPDHAEHFADTYKECKELMDQQEEFDKSFTNVPMSKETFKARDITAMKMIQHGLLTEAEYATKVRDQYADTLQHAGVFQNEPCDKDTMRGYLDVFKEYNDEDFTTVMIDVYLHDRDQRLDVIDKLKEDYNILDTFEATYQMSFEKYFDGFDGLRPIANHIRDLAIKYKQRNAETEKKRAEAEQERDRLQQQNDDIMRQLQEAQARLQELQAAGGGAPANDPRPPVSGQKRPRSAMKGGRARSRAASPSLASPSPEPEPERVDLISRPASRRESRASSPERRSKREKTPAVRFNPNTPK